jgi:hypothetical protein
MQNGGGKVLGRGRCGMSVFEAPSALAGESVQDFESLAVTQPGTFRCVLRGKFRPFRTPAARSTI